MMTRGGEGGKKCRKFDDVICERPLTKILEVYGSNILVTPSNLRLVPNCCVTGPVELLRAS